MNYVVVQNQNFPTYQGLRSDKFCQPGSYVGLPPPPPPRQFEAILSFFANVIYQKEKEVTNALREDARHWQIGRETSGTTTGGQKSGHTRDLSGQDPWRRRLACAGAQADSALSFVTTRVNE